MLPPLPLPASEPTFLDPLPQEFALLSAHAAASNALGLESVSSVIERLDRVRAQLAAGQPVDQLLLGLSTYVKGANTKLGAANKEWAGAVNRFGKGVDKVCLSVSRWGIVVPWRREWGEEEER